MDMRNLEFCINLINANKTIITAITLGIIILHTMLSASIQQPRNQDERGWGDECQSVAFAMITAVTLVHTRLKGRSFAMAIMCANMHGPRTPIAFDIGKKKTSARSRAKTTPLDKRYGTVLHPNNMPKITQKKASRRRATTRFAVGCGTKANASGRCGGRNKEPQETI